MSQDEPTPLASIPGIGPKRARALRVAGYHTIEDVANASESDLRAVPTIDDVLAHDLVATIGREEPAVQPAAPPNHVGPRDWRVTEAQLDHLADRTEDLSRDLVGSTAVDLRDRLEWAVDPDLLGFEEVCGRVVVHDPDTDEEHPVPNATVHVADTDCSFLSFFPEGLVYGWLFPFGCTREEIASVETDECGRFCVLVPRWDLDRVRTYRRERVCLPDIHRPRIRDVLENPRVAPEPVRQPRPRPDPLPIDLEVPGVAERVSDLLGDRVRTRLEAAGTLSDFGNPHDVTERMLDRPAFPRPIEPPLPPDVGEATAVDRLPESIPVDPDVLESIDGGQYVGPVLRCRDVFVPEWKTFVDVPDITFRVTQDVDGDGSAETIYREGYFDVRWNADSIPDLTLVASDDARSIPNCASPEHLDCDGPSIETVGLMPARAPYHDPSTGYSPRLNQPKPPTGPRPDGTAPYAGTLQLNGCHRSDEATYYRVLYSYEGENERAFTGETWRAPAVGRDPIRVRPVDDRGWYRILDVPYLERYYGESLADNPLIFPYWVLNWNTRRYRDGRYDVRIELGDDEKDRVGNPSPAVAFQVDNRAPHLQFEELAWGPLEDPIDTWDTHLTESCPRIRRPAGTDVGVRVTFRAWGEHFRSVRLAAIGCDENPRVYDPAPTGQPNTYAYWHRSVGDRSHRATVAFSIPASYPAGGYRLALHGFSRAFNPAGGGTGPGSNWTGNPSYIDSHASRLLSLETA